MNARERVIRALEFDFPDRPPRDLWYLPGVRLFRGQELNAILERYPSDFAAPCVKYGVSPRERGAEGRKGTYTDAWGCEWTAAEDGVCGEVKNPPLADWSALENYRAPWEILDRVDFSQTNASCSSSTAFMRAGTGVRPFERMQFLRGSENLYVDLITGPEELFHLRDLIHAFNLRELELWAGTKVDAISFMDDWGAQSSLLIDPVLWRSFFKPLYRDYCDILKSAGKYVFFHSDGYIRPIIEDLIEIGVDALNSQLFCMDMEELGRTFKGRLTFWGEICRQRILPFADPAEVKAAVRRVRRALGDVRGGVIAQCEWGNHDPSENIAAVFAAWEEPDLS